MARWATAIKLQREKDRNLLLLDAGNAFSQLGVAPEAAAEATIQGMNLLQYDALAVGEGELSLGVDFFRKMQNNSSFPLVSANLFVHDDSQSLGKRFLIKEANGISVGITSVISPAYFQNFPDLGKQIQVLDPAKALSDIIPTIRKQADLIILLSHLGEVETRSLVQKVAGIDVAVIGHDSGVLDPPVQAGKTLVVKNANKGMYFGALEIVVDSESHIVQTNNLIKKLAADVVADPAVGELLQTYQQAKSTSLREKSKAMRKNQMEEQLHKTLNALSPEEFVEQEMKRRQQVQKPAQPQ
ncbi:MAG TPA: hypothetical protein PKJ77_03915 [Thermodesulfobacteriota bacterium]|nr:hypothetical protein [Deltaproteobacteria bacterium]HNR13603.1 hypothetical protein [Thermodesulfobacteriota bacterium]HNU73036.1 hypothetical protein [Thermodesulfobacteriota bacterium]HOC38402.1 hypothetical protein [Thermodesulfobacteriota bacterium]